MGFLGDSAEKIRKFFRSDKASSAKSFAKGSTVSGASSTGYDVLQAYGYDVVSDYLKMEHDLLSRYVDYEEMDDYPELTAAIDIFADDATQTDMQLNRSIWVTSKDKDLEKLCNDLLHKTLRADEDIWEIARTLCKYGNSFEEILVDQNGVRGLNFLPPPTVRRVEGPRGELYGFIQDFKGRTGYSPAELQKIIAQRASGAHASGRQEHVVPLEDWEVVHFRLRNKQRRSIYGNSVLDGSRWIWKRLMLLEDSALVYRLQRAPERYAFYIDTGSLPPKEALAHVNKVRQNFKKKKFINPTTGKMDLKFNSLSPDEDIFIPSAKGNDSTRVEVLGSPSWQHMDDIEYFRDKMFSTLKIPKAYLGQDQGVARAVLSSEDTRFARSVQRIQRELRNGYSKIIRTHLAAIGIDPNRAEFQVHMTSPSSIFELAQLEVRNARADLASRMREHVSLPWVLANVFNMGDKEVETIIRQREQDTIRDLEAEGKGQAAAAKANPEEGFGEAGGFGAPTPSVDREPPGGELTPKTQEGPGPVESLEERRKRRLRGFKPITERELNGPRNVESEKRATEKFNQLMANDRDLANRIHEIRGMVRELVKYNGYNGK